MNKVSLQCVIVGQTGGSFRVDIETKALVGNLKKAIQMKKPNDLKDVDANKLQIFLAKKGKDEWLSSKDPDVISMRSGGIPEQVKALLHEEVDPTDEVGDLFGDVPTKNTIHVLVVVPRSGEENLYTVDPDIQLNLWKSVVRVSSEGVCSGTALVVHQTAKHLYLMTNLHLWTDTTFTDHVSANFKHEIKRLMSHKPQIVVELLLPDTMKLEEIHRFSLDSETCWRSSATFDFAIFEVPVPRNNKLVPCPMSLEVYDTMSVDVFGFPGDLQDEHFEHDYAIIPGQITGWIGNRMTLSSLSAPVLSGSVICTKRGVPVGYIGGELDGSAKNEYYGFTLHGILSNLRTTISHSMD